MLTLTPAVPGTPAQPTQHAMLVVWGHFAQTLALPSHLAHVPVPEKTVQHTPHAKLLTVLLGILAGNEYLRDLSHGPAPICRDPTVASAWGLPALPSASGVAHTRSVCDGTSLHALQGTLDTIATPFWTRALGELRAHQQPVQLDVDLTGRPVSSSSQTYPGAAFGYMDGQVRLGYQVAAVCWQTSLFGRQWVAGYQHAGDTGSTTCLGELIHAAEARLGCHPRRRIELLEGRIAVQQGAITAASQQVTTLTMQAQALHRAQEQTHRDVQAAHRRITVLQLEPISPHQGGPYGALTHEQQRVQRLTRREARLHAQLEQLRQRQRSAQADVTVAQAALAPLAAHRAQLALENAQQPDAPRCCLRMDAGFCSGENLSLVLELGYETETKVGHRGVIAALRERLSPQTVWTRVGQNAEMVGWTNYYIRTCPYPVTVALERFHTPQGLKYSVLLRSQADPTAPCPGLREWFSSYNARQTIEAGNKESKTVFKVQHLWSHSALGMQIQLALTLFAANFVAWSQEWMEGRIITPNRGMAQDLSRPAPWCGWRPTAPRWWSRSRAKWWCGSAP